MQKKLNVLFVSSGNSKNGISSLILNQGNSLVRNGVNIDYFSVNQRGIKGYLRAIKPLRKKIKQNNYDLIHAHYSFSGFLCYLSLLKIPIIVSLMGSDVKETKTMQLSSKLFAKYFWRKTIVKSYDLKNSLTLIDAEVVPNGVDLSHFHPMDKQGCQNKLGWDVNKKHLLFAADPNRKDKNFFLSKTAVELNNDDNIKLHYLKNVAHADVPVYMNASDVILLSSPYEGSPNVIKEAMACNVPIVSTDVGDVKEVISGTEGCYISSMDVIDFADKIKIAISFERKTNGRENILHLESNLIAQKIITIYKSIL
jgi:teichuronic acid biosynthesis glycosyltransferase TuaC